MPVTNRRYNPHSRTRSYATKHPKQRDRQDDEPQCPRSANQRARQTHEVYPGVPFWQADASGHIHGLRLTTVHIT